MKLRASGAAAIAAAFVLSLPVCARADHHLKPIANCTIISEPGSYVVTKMIFARERDLSPGALIFIGCIVIAADFVSLDLQGHTIVGPGASRDGPFSVGVLTDSQERRAIKVHNGAVTGFFNGVSLFGAGHSTEHLRSTNNANAGIALLQGAGAVGAALGHRAVANSAFQNGGAGLIVTCPSLILGNTATANGTSLETDEIVLNILDPTKPCTRLENYPAP